MLVSIFLFKSICCFSKSLKKKRNDSWILKFHNNIRCYMCFILKKLIKENELKYLKKL